MKITVFLKDGREFVHTSAAPWVYPHHFIQYTMSGGYAEHTEDGVTHWAPSEILKIVHQREGAA